MHPPSESWFSHLEGGVVVDDSEHFFCAEPKALYMIYLFQFPQCSPIAGAVRLILPEKRKG